MRAFALGLLAMSLPGIAQAAGAWCDVSPTTDTVTPVKARLAPLLDSAPHPRDHIHTEGTLPHQGIRDESLEAKKDLPLMRDAAYAWRGGAGDAYLTMAERYFNAWVATYQPNFNPIDETNFDALIDTYAVIAPKLSAADNAAARRFLTDWAKGYIASVDSHQVVSQSPQATTWNNNWQSHRIKLITMIAVALDDPALFTDARRLFQAQVEANIHADGEVRDFAERDAMHYVIYDLEPLTHAALAARTRGEDWFTYQSLSGASVAKGFAWLRPYAAGEKPHEEFKNSKVAFDAQRAAAGEKGYSGPFEPRTAGEVFWMASVFVPDYADLARKLQPNPPSYLALCGN